MKITHKIDADLQKRSTTPRLLMVQCDTDFREIEITLTSGGTAWVPESVDSVFLRYRKSDGTGGCYDTLPDGTRAWTAVENIITVGVAPQMLMVPGLVEAQVAVVAGTGCAATFTFQIIVEADPSVGVIESEDYVNWSEWTKVKLDALLEQAKESGYFAGYHYTPAVDAEGNLTWSNDGGLENPDSVNIADLVVEKVSGDILQGEMVRDLNMNGYRLYGLNAPEKDTEAAPKGYVDTAKSEAKVEANAYTNEQVKKAAPRNLLDNSCFRNPVNQRGQTSYADSGYTIDRWNIGNNAKLTVESDHIAVTGNGGTAYPKQYVLITPEMRGKYITAAIGLKDGTVHIFGGGMIPLEAVSENTTIGTYTTLADGTVLNLSEYTNGCIRFMIGVPDGVTAELCWAALYEGMYTAETLPEYRTKGYGAELAECQRYCQVIGAYGFFRSAAVNSSAVFITVPLPVPFRIIPSISSGTFVVRNLSGSEQSDFTFAVNVIGDGWVRIDASKASHGLSDAVLRTNSKVILSADL